MPKVFKNVNSARHGSIFLPAFVPINVGRGKLKGAPPEGLAKLVDLKTFPCGGKVATAKPLTDEGLAEQRI